MKIAIVIPGAWYSNDPSKFSVNLSFYIDAILELGHEPLIVCRNDSEFSVDYSVLAVSTEELSSAPFWADLNLDIAIVFTWLRHSAILHALNDARVYTVSRADSDGMASVRVFPRHHYRMVLGGAKLSLRTLADLHHLLRRYLFLFKDSDTEVIESLNAANLVLIETETAKESLEWFLTCNYQQHLSSKLLVQPHYVPRDFLTSEVLVKRAKKIVAIGRWDDPQKNVTLLTKALDAYLLEHTDVEVILIGRGGKSAFAQLTAKYANAQYLGVVARDQIKQHLAECRFILFTSLWEGAPVSASETLALGGTVVGTPIPGIQGFVLTENFGTVAKGFKPAQIVDAMENEMALWESESRDSQQVAGYWRPKLSALNSMSEIVKIATQHLSDQVATSSRNRTTENAL